MTNVVKKRRLHIEAFTSSLGTVHQKMFLWGHKATNSYFKGRVPFSSREMQDCQLKSSINNNGAKRYSFPVLFLLCNLPRHYMYLAQWNLLLISVYDVDFENMVSLSLIWNHGKPDGASPCSPSRRSLGLSHISKTKRKNMNQQQCSCLKLVST